jgi:hypothetical protein
MNDAGRRETRIHPPGVPIAVRSRLQDFADDLRRHAGVFGIVHRSLASLELGNMAEDELELLDEHVAALDELQRQFQGFVNELPQPDALGRTVVTREIEPIDLHFPISVRKKYVVEAKVRLP